MNRSDGNPGADMRLALRHDEVAASDQPHIAETLKDLVENAVLCCTPACTLHGLDVEAALKKCGRLAILD